MTTNNDFKRLVRKRMLSTAQNYTSARASLLNDRSRAEAVRAKTLKAFMRDGRLVSIPAKRRPLVVVLLEILRVFEPGRTYGETDVNAILGDFHPDFARLRRELIDYRYLARDAYTGRYWVNSRLPERRGNHLQETGDFEAFLR